VVCIRNSPAGVSSAHTIADAASCTVYSRRCGTLQIMLMCREASWLPVFLTGVNASDLRLLQLVHLRADEAEWPWVSLDNLFGDEMRWPRLEQIQVLATDRNCLWKAASLPLFEARSGVFKVRVSVAISFNIPPC
jgi:hypothetical protein